nr:hypothetical protein [Caldilineaceae bacterium]
CVVDANQVGHIVERMRISVPSAIMESERTLAERDQILAEAHSEAERILQDARQRVAEIVSDQSIVVTARNEAERIVEEGRTAASRRADEADQYAMQVLEDLAHKLQTISAQVDNGVQVMRNNRLPAPSGNDIAGQH